MLNSIVAWRDGQPISAQEFQTHVQAWYTLLADTVGEKFALYFNDSFEFASALLGGWQAGKILYLPGNALPGTCESLQNVVDGYLGDFPINYRPLIPIIRRDAIHRVSATNQNTINPRDAMDPRDAINRVSTVNDSAGLVIYTSGSTGNPQEIPKNLTQLMTEVTTLENLFGNLIGNAEIIATVSHQHIYGLLFKILWPLTTGRPIHIRNVTFLEELIPLLTTRDSVLVTSPAHLKRFCSSPTLVPPNHLRALFSSGAILPLNIAQTTQQLLGKIPIEVYGSSETGGIAWRQRPNESWQPLPGINWRIAAEEKVLEIHSPHLPNDNWFRTADRVTAAKNNGFFLQERIDRIVKLEGKRISLNTLEHCLTALPFVTEARVLMLEKNNQRQRIAAFIVLTTDGQTKLAEIGKLAFNQLLRNRLANSIERIALPRSWHYLDALPVNAQGKTTHVDLMALLAHEHLTLPQQHLLEKNVGRVVLELTIPKNLFYFEGHFPAAPILPGVVQIDWAIIYGRQHFNLPLFFCGIQALKFQHVIQPEMTIMLELLYDNIKTTLTFRLYSQAGQHASGRILFGTSND